jgi:DNA repair exonuclease SbcCD ATPase subunit
LRALEQERDQITKQLEDILTLHEELKERCKRLVDEHEEKEQLLRGFKETHIKATNRLIVARTDLEEAVARNDALQKQTRYQASELQAKDEKIRSLEGSLADMAKLQDQRQVESADRRIRMLEDQVRRQTSELKAVKTQTRSASGYRAGPIRESHSGVIGLIDTLNTEIFQAAAFMADSLEYKGRESVAGIDVKQAIERASRTMGKPMVLVLRSRLTQNGTEFDPLAIQIALQACMVTCCVKIMASWYPGHWEYADFLATIYSRIQGSGASVTVF